MANAAGAATFIDNDIVDIDVVATVKASAEPHPGDTDQLGSLIRPDVLVTALDHVNEAFLQHLERNRRVQLLNERQDLRHVLRLHQPDVNLPILAGHYPSS